MKKNKYKAIADFISRIRLQLKTGKTEIDSNDMEAYNKRGLAYLEKKNYDAAIANYTELIRINPDYTEAYFNRGVAYLDKGDLDAAIKDFTSVIKNDPNKIEAYFNRGIAYFAKGDVDAAIEDYTLSIRINPDYTNAYINRGFVYLNKEEYDKAIEDFTSVIKKDPNNINAYFNRGLAHKLKEDYDAAIADFEAVLRIDPDDADSMDNIEEIRKTRGEADKIDTPKSDKPQKISFSKFNKWVKQSKNSLLESDAFFDEEDEFSDEGVMFYEGDLTLDNADISPCLVVDGDLTVNHSFHWQFDMGLLVVNGNLRCPRFDFPFQTVITGDLITDVIDVQSGCDYYLKVGGNIIADTLIERGHLIEALGVIRCKQVYSFHIVKDSVREYPKSPYEDFPTEEEAEANE